VGDIVSQNTREDFLFDDTEQKIECEEPIISDLLKKDQEIMVQVIKQQGGTKGVRVTTNITLPGRNIVFMPTVEHIGVSRKIVSEEERERLRNAVMPYVPEGAGVIVRTAAAKACAEELAAEIKVLEAKWQRIKENELYRFLTSQNQLRRFNTR
jgi:ribonuclease G